MHDQRYGPALPVNLLPATIYYESPIHRETERKPVPFIDPSSRFVRRNDECPGFFRRRENCPRRSNLYIERYVLARWENQRGTTVKRFESFESSRPSVSKRGEILEKRLKNVTSLRASNLSGVTRENHTPEMLL